MSDRSNRAATGRSERETDNPSRIQGAPRKSVANDLLMSLVTEYPNGAMSGLALSTKRRRTERGDRPPKRWNEHTPSEHRERASTGRRERPPTEWGDRPPNRRGEQTPSGPGGRSSVERGERPLRQLQNSLPTSAWRTRRPSDKYADKPADRRPARPFSGQPAEKTVGRDSLPLNGPFEANRKAASVPEGIRVSKLLAERGICSRREADDFIVRAGLRRWTAYFRAWHACRPQGNTDSRQAGTRRAAASDDHPSA